MTDECKHCVIRGDIGICKSSTCSKHESWYAIEQQKIIDKNQARYSQGLSALSDAIDIIESILNDPDVCNVFKCHADYDDLDSLKSTYNEALSKETKL